MSQRAGRPSEKEFNLLCSKAGVTCNKSDEDDHGWDFIVEIPVTYSHDVPADLSQPVKPILVQVKSTSGKVAKTSLKVSNALQFAKSELPCFVVLFHQQPGGTSRIYARHYWTDLIERSLKRARQASVNNQAVHKAKMQVSFSDDDDHSENLIRWLIDTTVGFPPRYSSEKRRLGETLGYGDGSWRGEITFGPNVGIEELVDNQLGLTDVVPASFVKMVDARFDIEPPVSLFVGSEAQVRMRSLAVKDAQLVLQAQDGKSLTLPAKLTAPAIPGLPFDKLKLKIETWMICVVVQHGKKVNCNVSVSMEDRMPLQHLIEFASFISWGLQGAIEFKIVGDRMPLLHGHVNMNLTGDEPFFREFLVFAKTLNEVQNRAGLCDVDLSFQDILKAGQRLVDFHRLLTASDMNVSLAPGPGWMADVDYSQMLGYADVIIGDLTFFVIFDAPINEQTKSGGFVSVAIGSPVWRDCIVGRAEDDVQTSGLSSYKRREAVLGAGTLGFGDILAIAGSGTPL